MYNVVQGRRQRALSSAAPAHVAFCRTGASKKRNLARLPSFFKNHQFLNFWQFSIVFLQVAHAWAIQYMTQITQVTPSH